MEALEEYTLDSFDSIAEPTSQEVMVCVTGVDRRDDMEGHLPWASRLDHTELVEMARRRRREILGRVPQEACKGRVVRPRTSGSKG